MGFFHRIRGLTPYLLLGPGLLWLGVFFLVPLGFLGYQSLQSGTIDFGYAFTWQWSNYWNAIRDYHGHFIRSFEYAAIATVIALVVSYPVAYWIAFHGGRWKNLLLLVTFPLSLPGVVAGTLLTFIPAAGDFINAQLLGSPKNHMIGNVIQSKFLAETDYPAAASMSFVLMALIVIMVLLYARAVGTEQLTGSG